ncbi:hypothetical protein BC835DRAFT_172661 [Cytidiella melzeri]|nr:hypothetical protein BC835DRAFT_172661 [Cytidiella melzeri]
MVLALCCLPCLMILSTTVGFCHTRDQSTALSDLVTIDKVRKNCDLGNTIVAYFSASLQLEMQGSETKYKTGIPLLASSRQSVSSSCRHRPPCVQLDPLQLN